jgi:hypothetical protein
MNKFDALKQFMGWPHEWQRLCAEYWIETGEDRPAVQAPWPFDQPKAAKVAAKPARKHHSKLAWSAAESEYLLKLASEDQPLWNVVAFFLSRYPGRSRDAVRRRAWGIRNGKPESEVKY